METPAAAVEGTAAPPAAGPAGAEGSRRISAADLLLRFGYRSPDRRRAEMHEDVRAGIHGLARWLVETLPPGRETSLVVTHLEEVMFWSNAAIARHVEDL